MDEQYYEKLLNIRSSGEQKIFKQSLHYHRYEPTSYSALEVLTKQYEFAAEDTVVDFGCGKGRFSFYLNYFFNTTVTGIEMNNFFYSEAIENKKSYFQMNKNNVRFNKKDNIDFINCYAEKYNINPSENKFYFFNPFSVQIFTKVVTNILTSTQEYERRVDIILYYPSIDYTYFLDNNTSFSLINEIKVPHLYDNDPRHKFSIYRL